MSAALPHFIVREADPDEFVEILGVQHRAFGRVAAEFGIRPEDLPPIRETLADLEALAADGERFFVAVTTDGTVVGSVRGRIDDEGVVEIGRLVVDDGWQRKGVATTVMDALEAAFPEATRFKLFTGAEAAAPLALYAKRGYRESGRQDLGYVVLVWLEKAPGSA